MKDINIQASLEKVAIDSQFSGVVSVKKDGEMLYEKAFGEANRCYQAPNNMKTRFGIASGTKFFTALAIGRLIDEGKLALTTKLKDIIKFDFPTYSEDVTVEHLLTHTSGLPDYFNEDELGDDEDFFVDIPWYDLKEPKEYFPIFPQTEMVAKPGVDFKYNNSGYVLLAAMVAEVSGKSYREFLEQEVFARAGMDSSGMYFMDCLPPNTATGYLEAEGNNTNIFKLPIVGGGDGGAYTTSGDVYQLWDALLQGKIISHELVEFFTTPRVQEDEDTYYGCGLWITKRDGGLYVAMEGCDLGVSFLSVINKETKLIYTILSNTTSGAWPLARAIRELKL